MPIKLYNLLGKNYSRKYWLKKTKSEVMRDFLNQPYVSRRNLIKETDIISLDIENSLPCIKRKKSTKGLNKKDSVDSELLDIISFLTKVNPLALEKIIYKNI